MENFAYINSRYSLHDLEQSELISIEGGSIAYDVGHFVGSVALGVIVALVCKTII